MKQPCNHEAAVKQGLIPELIRACERGSTLAMKQEAMGAMANLAMTLEYQAMILEEGGIRPLVVLMSSPAKTCQATT